MLTLGDLRSNLNPQNYLKASIYKFGRVYQGEAFINNFTTYPKNQINGITVCVGENGLVTSGQLTTYTPDEGIKVHMLDADLRIAE